MNDHIVETTIEQPIVLRTPRLVLRRWEAGNELEITEEYQYGRNPKVAEAGGWPSYDDIEECRRYHDVVQARDPECFAIIYKQTGLPIGSIAFKTIPEKTSLALGHDPSRCREVGYWIGEPHWGRGFMPEALEAMLEHGFDTLGLDIVYAKLFQDNSRSRAVLGRCGFTYDHTEYGNVFPQLHRRLDEDALSLAAADWRNRKEQRPLAHRTSTSAYWGADPDTTSRPQC
ncbi:GNAT family N-acetyltransferase [Bifidobacterium sp.]|jgi:RimJ/RimL family protein N-acetyltransferase|uniref:GNAT family N-acetyltransferase n=1 Tax=Bifidobacterium sp. TaxID=41200 RepID=UPI0025C04460|nr:GNAT family N-acetyltransferase [Bifidobacterium sp.]MCH4209323.1 GNAT family N-acetyltransferase [Bifidobacterium sp.]MCI1224117.1 GNAT family N-acetyltransferase [Bifidobacterium sp.]